MDTFKDEYGYEEEFDEMPTPSRLVKGVSLLDKLDMNWLDKVKLEEDNIAAKGQGSE